MLSIDFGRWATRHDLIRFHSGAEATCRAGIILLMIKGSKAKRQTLYPCALHGAGIDLTGMRPSHAFGKRDKVSVC